MYTSKKDAKQRLFLRPGIGPYAVRSQGWQYGECPWMNCIAQKASAAAKTAKQSLFSLFLIALTQTVSAETACSLPHDQLSEYDEITTVRYVHDGDTLHLKDGRKVRLIGINTPEVAHGRHAAQPYSAEAKSILKAFFDKDNRISLVFGEEKQDHYHRVLAHGFSKNGTNIQAALLNQGYAHAITFPPNSRFTSCYLEQERQARCNKTGFWKKTKLLKAKRLNDTHIGFNLITGKVNNINIDKKGIWINLNDKLTIGIRPENQSLFNIENIVEMTNKNIVVRGWLNTSKKSNPYYLRIRHPSAIQLANQFSCK